MMKILAFIVALAIVASASAITIYQNNFSLDAAGFSGGDLVSGQYKQANNAAVLDLNLNSSPPYPATYTLEVDFTTLGTWDISGSYGPDQVIVIEFGSTIFTEAFGAGSFSRTINNVTNNSQPGALSLSFRTNVTGSDELLALDRVKIYADNGNGVPDSGATYSLMALGLLGLFAASKRFRK